jgi:hypothetical protein
MADAILKRGKGFQIGEGTNIWNRKLADLQIFIRRIRTDCCEDIHIDDLSDAFLTIVEESLKPNGGRAAWGKEGYYYTETGEFVSPSFSSHSLCTLGDG